MPSFEYSRNGPLLGYAYPAAVLCQTVDVTWEGGPSLELVGIKWDAKIAGADCPGGFIHVGQWCGEGNRRASFLLQIPWNRALIHAIEAKREPGTGVSFQVTVKASYRAAVVVENRAEPPDGFGAYLHSAWERAGRGSGLQIQVHGEEWREVLEQIGWGVTEVFELDLQKLTTNERLARGLHHFRQAEAAHRQGQWREVCTQARFACAAMAGVSDPQAEASEREGAAIGDFVQGLFPDKGDGDRRQALDHALRCIGALRNHVSHLGPRAQPQRHDAELALSCLAAVLRFVGEHLRER